MNQKSKATKNTKTSTPVQIRDLDTKKDPKAGIIGILIDLNTQGPKPAPPPPPPTTK
jgi:hypothetical protein